MELVLVVPSLLGAIVGGLLTGFFSLAAANRSFSQQKEKAEKDEKTLITGVLQSIHDEMTVLLNKYISTMGEMLENLPEGEPLIAYYPIISDFFTVYNGNSFLLGRIPDSELRSQIIRTYTHAKSVIDSFYMNNELVRKFETANLLYDETGQDVHRKHALAHYKSLQDYAFSLKEEDKNLKREISNLLFMLREYIKKVD